MSLVLIYSYQISPGTFYNVSRDTTDYRLIYAKAFTGTGGTSGYAPGVQVGVPVCIPDYLKVTYRFQSTAPFAYPDPEENSPYCGYTPLTCDIAIVTLNTTNETAFGANDGTVQIFATSSNTPQGYLIDGPVSTSNSTGYFTGLPPGDYTTTAFDVDNPCLTTQPFTIQPSTYVATHYKYRLQFNSIKDNIVWECRFLDVKNNYDSEVYPIDLTGADQPIMCKVDNPDEDKTEPMCLKTLTMNLWNNGIFTIDEFALSDERTWKIELYRNGELDFQGWLLPDQIQDLYADPNYGIQLVATDGISSLKGNEFADQSLYTLDEQGNVVYQKLYGVKSWAYLVRCCLNQLDYDFQETTLLSSLQINGDQTGNMWVNVGTWGDLFYDESGVAVDTYTALSLLLRGFNLFITQIKGRFVIGTTNDMVYINNTIKAAKYKASFYAFDKNFTELIPADYAQYPPLIAIGRGTQNQPINPPQSINYDNAYQVEQEDVSFNALALLYENPSFEIGSVQGEIPDGFTNTGRISAFLNYDPQTLTTGAFDGSWEYRITGWTDYGLVVSPSTVYFSSSTNDETQCGGFIIDTKGLKLNLSFVWRPHALPSGQPGNAEPGISIIFVTDLGVKYYYNPAITDPNTSKWLTSGTNELFRLNNGNVIDLTRWNNYSLDTDVFPDSGLGNLYFQFWGAIQVDDHFMAIAPGGFNMTYDVDQLALTVSSSNAAFNLQTGETHLVKNPTQYTKAEKKTIEQSLFTYPANKRTSGNVFDFYDYEIGNVVNAWDYALNSDDDQDRLPATIVKAVSRNYQRPMYIFEGDVKSDDIQFWAVFTLVGYPGVLFMPFSIETDLRNSESHIVIVELNDSTTQNSYYYIPKYESNARSN